MRPPTGARPAARDTSKSVGPRCSSRRRRARHTRSSGAQTHTEGRRRHKAWACASRRELLSMANSGARWYEWRRGRPPDSSPGRWHRATDSRPGQIGSRARAHSGEAAVYETVEQALDVRVRPTGELDRASNIGPSAWQVPAAVRTRSRKPAVCKRFQCERANATESERTPNLAILATETDTRS